MKIVLLTVNSAKEKWSEEVVQLYQKKLNHFFSFEIVNLKPKKYAREDSEVKRKSDSEQLLGQISSDDYVIVFDERGESLNSPQYAKKINSALNCGKKRIVLVLGGAFGLTEDVRKKAQLNVSLSSMVYNHLIAEAVILEQTYRAFTILKNIPYHNE